MLVPFPRLCRLNCEQKPCSKSPDCPQPLTPSPWVRVCLNDTGGVLVGSVLRKALCVILQQKAFGHPDATGPEALELKAKQGK